jgi:hypothetical protein
MTETIEINASYCTSAVARVALPDGTTWNDVKDWFIKWDTLHIKFEGETKWAEYPLESHSDADSTDWKRPSSVSIHPVVGDDVDYETDYAGDDK